MGGAITGPGVGLPLEQEAEQVDEAGLVPSADQIVPEERNRAAPSGGDGAECEAQIVGAVCCGKGVENVAAVPVEAGREKVVDGDRWIVDQTPAGTFNGEAKTELPVYLGAGTAQARVEADRSECRRAEGAVNAFEDIDLTRRADAEMVIADDAAEPEDAADQGFAAGFGAPVLLDPITATDAAAFWIRGEMRLDAGEPIGTRGGVVVGDCNNVGCTASKAGVHGVDDAGGSYFDEVDRQMILPRRHECGGFFIAYTDDDQDQIRATCLLREGGKAAREIGRTTVGGDEHGGLHRLVSRAFRASPSS